MRSMIPRNRHLVLINDYIKYGSVTKETSLNEYGSTVTTQLLCTFTSVDEIDQTLEDIQSHYDVAFGKVFVLENEDDLNELFCTYNIDKEGDNEQLDDTISVHRKRDTNTIFTINALNELIRELNDGELDKSYSIPWQNYDNRILLTSYGDLKQVHTNLHRIHEIDE